MTFELFGRRLSFFANEEQWSKAATLLKQYFLNPAVICAAAVLIVWAVLYIYMCRTKRQGPRELLRKISPAVYLFLILAFSVFNRPFGPMLPFHFGFDFIFEGTSGLHETRIAMAVFNFVYFIPYGIVLSWSCLFRKDLLALAAVVFTGFLAEALQSVLGAGVGSVEHVVMYVLGGLCGVGIYKIAVWHRKEKVSPKV